MDRYVFRIHILEINRRLMSLFSFKIDIMRRIKIWFLQVFSTEEQALQCHSQGSLSPFLKKEPWLKLVM